MDGEKFKPLEPIDAEISSSTLYVDFNVPEGKLTWDIEQVAKMDDYGFELYDSMGNSIAIKNIFLLDEDTVEIDTDSELDNECRLVYGQTASIPGKSKGSRGNLRDEQGDMIQYQFDDDNLRMDNWCVLFDMKISEIDMDCN